MIISRALRELCGAIPEFILLRNIRGVLGQGINNDANSSLRLA